MVKIINLKKMYKGGGGINDVSLNFISNEINGLAGTSGSGKTTLLRIISGIEKFDSGEVKVNKPVGFMFQDFQLFPHMNVLKNLTYAASIKKNDKEKKMIKNEAEIILEKLGMNEHKNKFPHELSGGEKQRVALARSLIMKPNVLLCDEPTSGLDISSINLVLKIFSDLKKSGITIIISSHDLDFLTSACKKIFVIKSGKIITSIMNEEENNKKNVVEEIKKYY